MAQPCRCSVVRIVAEGMCSVVANTGAATVQSVAPSRSAVEVVAADSVRRSVEPSVVDVGLVGADYSHYSCKSAAASVADCGMVDRAHSDPELVGRKNPHNPKMMALEPFHSHQVRSLCYTCYSWVEELLHCCHWLVS